MTNQNSKRNKKFLFFNCNFDFCTLIFEILQILISFGIFLFFPNFVYSTELNNKFGVHFAQPHHSDIKKAAEMINGNGGDWGYITLVIQENDRDKQKWQEIFDYLRELHLIPIIRLATVPTGPSWQRPRKDGADDWVKFLDSLNWVVKKRYIILFNEPNHGAEWGGEADPRNYAEVAFEFAKKLKEKNPDFFVMLAGFDASSPHQPPRFWDEEIFLRELLGTARELIESENTKKYSNESQSKSNNNISVDLPKVRIIHNNFTSNLYEIYKQNVPKIKSIVNTRKLEILSKPEKLGIINTAPYQPADRFISNPDKVLRIAFFDFLEERNFIKSIFAEEKNSVKKDLFDYIDGWVSHSYPNPAFSGSPWDRGRGTVRTYEWELELLKNLGVTKQLPVFITETGWIHNQYQISNIKYQKYQRLTPEIVAEYFKIAFEQVWLPDERVMAVTPFVFDYQGEPFLGFSWKKFQSEDYYPQYYVVQSIPKIKGEPKRIEKGEIIADLPKELVNYSNYHLRIKLKNKGQAIWDKEDSYKLEVRSDKLNTKEFDYVVSDIKNIKPFEEAEVDLYIKTNKTGLFSSKLALVKKDRPVIETENWQYEIVPLPSLKFSVQIFPKLTANGDDFEIQIFDENEELVFKKNGIKVKKGKGFIEEIQNVIPGKRYRLVILKPYYLPRQDFLIIHKGENFIRFKKMLPFDFDKNGRFNKEDIIEFFQNLSLIKFVLP